MLRHAWLWSVAAPGVLAVDTVTPNHGPAGTPVVVMGSGFTHPGLSASLGLIGVDSFLVTSDNQLSFNVPNTGGAAGPTDLAISFGGGPGQTVHTTFGYEVAGGAAPAVTAVSPNLGDVLGGEFLAITGTGFTGATAVTIGGAAVLWYTVVSDTLIYAGAPAHPAAAGQSVLVTSPGGTNTANTLYEFWAPSELALTGFWERGDYLPGTWTARGSAGSSAGRNFVQTTAAQRPADTNLEPSFDGVDDRLELTATTLATLFTAGAGSGWMIVRPDNAATPGNDYQETALLSDWSGTTGDDYLMLAHTTSGFRFSMNDGVSKHTPYVAAPVGTLHVVYFKWDGTNIAIRLNGGAWQSATAGALTNLTRGLQLGLNYNYATIGPKFRGVVRAFGTQASAIADADADKILKWAQARHGVAA